MTDHSRIAFGPDEVLYRRIEKRAHHKDDDTVKHTYLRLQVSVDRSAFVTLDDVPPGPPKFNGIAEIKTADARACRCGNVAVVCVDEPLKDRVSHALVALTTDHPPGIDLADDVDKARMAIGKAMKVVRAPT